MAIELLDLLADEIGTAGAGATLSGVLGFEDDALKRFPVTSESKRTVYYLPGGVNTVLTEAMMRYDIIAADNPAMTTLEVPENATLGLDYTDTAADHRFYVQNRGAGGLSVNFTGDANLDFNYHELTIETEGPYHAEQCFFSYEEDSWGTT
jgi:hypothetical protein